jgi:hypothetical protein
MLENIDNKRIPAARVVQAAKPIIKKDSRLSIWMDPSKVLIVDANQVAGQPEPSYPISSSLSSPTSLVAPGLPSSKTDATITESDISEYLTRTDTPDLSDIESIVVTQYKDTLGNSKAKAVIKVRNSFSFPENVVGVDARIYNPFA